MKSLPTSLIFAIQRYEDSKADLEREKKLSSLAGLSTEVLPEWKHFYAASEELIFQIIEYSCGSVEIPETNNLHVSCAVAIHKKTCYAVVQKYNSVNDSTNYYILELGIIS